MKDSREIITTKTTETTHELERPFEPPYAVNGNGNYPMYRGATTQELSTARLLARHPQAPVARAGKCRADYDFSGDIHGAKTGCL